MHIPLESLNDVSRVHHQWTPTRQEMKRSKSLELRRTSSQTAQGTSSQRSQRSDMAFTSAGRRGTRPSGIRSKSRSRLCSEHGSRQVFYDEHGRRFIRMKKKKKEEKLPRTLVLIWIIVAAELGFDLATTIIAFLSFVREANCCGKPIELVLGNISLGLTIPFFGLVMIELLTLIRIIFLTLWPSASSDDDHDDAKSVGKTNFVRCCCNCLKMNAKALMRTLNYLFILNPIFGCVIAWMLMYQSDRREAFTVLGLEGISLILHFASICVEGSFRTFKQIAFHLTPLIPFFVSIGMVGYYIKQGGVCYLPEEKLFRFYGCEICNVAGTPEPCAKGFVDLWGGGEIPNSLQDIGNIITKRTQQSTYCSAEVNFCFFDYTNGKKANVVLLSCVKRSIQRYSKIMPCILNSQICRIVSPYVPKESYQTLTSNTASMYDRGNINCFNSFIKNIESTAAP